MHVAEVIGLTNWIDTEITEKDILGHYSRLHQVLASNASTQQQQPFETEKDQLLAALAAVPLQSLTTQQLEFLDCLGIAKHVGAAAVDAVEDLLFRNALDAATAAERLQQAAQAVQAGTARSVAIQNDLKGCVPEAADLENEALIRVAFTSNASISNIVELKKWSSKWHEIGRGLAMAHDVPPESIRVVGAGRGSILIELAVVYGVARTVTTVILESLKIAERVLTIRLTAEKLTNLKLSNTKLAGEVEKEAKKALEEGAATISAVIAESTGLTQANHGDRLTALEKSVKGLLDFLDKGGEVDCVLPPESSDLNEEEEEDAELVADLTALRAAFQEIRLREGTLKQIGAGSSGHGA